MDRKQGLRTLFTLQRARIGARVTAGTEALEGPGDGEQNAVADRVVLGCNRLDLLRGVHDRGRDRSDDLVEETSAAEVSRRPAGIRIVTAAPMIAGRANANS